jgi:MarR family 2-MHQ and catechol resistance regulon transcriptional repressor
MPSANERDLFTTLGLLFEASATIQRGVEADIEGATGLPGPWFETLLRLERSDAQGVRVSDMANQVSFAPSSFSRLLDRIEAEGLVARVADPTNRRATLIQLTPEGHERVVAAMEVHEPSAQQRVVEVLTDDEIDALETITRKLRDANCGAAPPTELPGGAESRPSPGTALTPTR